MSCHMPQQTYMVVDPRRDHSFRIPRPDLTVSIGTPNACNACHTDESAEWAAEKIREWTGTAPEPHFATAFSGAQRGDPEALGGIAEVALDTEQPSIVRATALALLRVYGRTGAPVAQALLADPDPMVRAAAVRALDVLPETHRLAAVNTLEDDDLGVRLEAVLALAPAPMDQLGPEWGAIFQSAVDEFREAQALSADLPAAHLNLAILADRLGELDAAEAHYRTALEHDTGFLPARFNLATLLNRRRRNVEAESVLRAGLELAPQEGELHYSLGLLLAEMQRPEEAADSLVRAAARMPGNARVSYNAGLALQGVDRDAEAEVLLGTAADLGDPDAHHALILLHAERGDRGRALEFARRMSTLLPDAPPAEELLEDILERAGVTLE